MSKNNALDTLLSLAVEASGRSRKGVGPSSTNAGTNDSTTQYVRELSG